MLAGVVRWGRGVVNRVCQPGFGIALAVLLFVLQPLLPTAGHAAHVVHIILWVVAGVLLFGMAIWAAGLWKIPVAAIPDTPPQERASEVDVSAIALEVPAPAGTPLADVAGPAFRFEMARPTGFPSPGPVSRVGLRARFFGRRILD